MKKLCCLLLGITLAGCAADTNQIRATYVSPRDYDDCTCDQLKDEAIRVTRQAREVGARVNETAETDDTQMAVGLILFWPTLFFLEGEDTLDTQEYAELKGRSSAIEEASIRKQCGIEFRSLP